HDTVKRRNKMTTRRSSSHHGSEKFAHTTLLLLLRANCYCPGVWPDISHQWTGRHLNQFLSSRAILSQLPGTPA
ncbi:hypothetical protein BgiBS90_003947, partial [Biomphalaria glabrata]